MKICDITAEAVSEYLKIGPFAMLDAIEQSFIEACMSASAAYVASYTGRTADVVTDKPSIHDDDSLGIAYLVLIGDMYDNRSANIDKGSPNRTVETILNMFSINLL